MRIRNLKLNSQYSLHEISREKLEEFELEFPYPSDDPVIIEPEDSEDESESEVFAESTLNFPN